MRPARFGIVLGMMALAAWAALPRHALAQDETATAEAEHATEDHSAAAHDDAAHAGGHDEHAAANPLDFKADLALWTLVVFVVLLTVLWKFAWGPIAAGLDHREHKIAGHIDSAQQANQRAQELLADYERKLAASHDEVRGILDEARRDAERTQQEILAKAQADADATRNRALGEIETATAQALKELAEKSANLAVDLAGKIVQAKLNPEDHAALISQSLNRFQQIGRN
jgi:F-type H+-transporting ATPase subunit b